MESVKLIKYIKENNYEKVKEIIKQKDIDINNNIHDLPILIFFTVAGEEDIVKLLVEREDININIKCKYGATALMYAAKFGKIEIVKLLLNHPKININIQDNDVGNTALMHASVNNYIKIVELLLEREDININNQDNRGYSAYSWAYIYGHKKVMKKLINHNTNNIIIKKIIPYSLLIGASVCILMR